MNLIFRNFAWNDDVKSFFCIEGTSWMGCGRVEWYWDMGTSYLTSLNHQLFKNKAYVGSFNHFSVQILLHVFCNSAKTSANSSGHSKFFFGLHLCLAVPGPLKGFFLSKITLTSSLNHFFWYFCLIILTFYKYYFEILFKIVLTFMFKIVWHFC